MFSLQEQGNFKTKNSDLKSGEICGTAPLAQGQRELLRRGRTGHKAPGKQLSHSTTVSTTQEHADTRVQGAPTLILSSS